MTSTPAPNGSTPSGNGAAEGRWPARRTGRRLLIGLLVAVLAGMWVFALSGLGRRESPNRLDDHAFSETAEEVCSETLLSLEGLPPAHETPDPRTRADVITDANRELSLMVGTLRTFAPEEGRDGRMVSEWLGDWDTYIGDRWRLADELRVDSSARLRETSKGGDHISEALDGFAVVNDMPSCATPGDVA